MNISKSLFALALAISSLSLTVSAKADTVQARCEVYAYGNDRPSSSAPCTFSQRQGAVSIELQNGKRYELSPISNKPGRYRDQNGQVVRLEDRLGDSGLVYRFPTKSIFVYWKTNTEEPQSKKPVPDNSQPITPAARTNIALVGKTVEDLEDLVGARGGQAENAVIQRGYQFVRNEADNSDNRVFAFWRQPGTGLCVAIITKEGRYDRIVYANVTNQKTCK